MIPELLGGHYCRKDAYFIGPELAWLGLETNEFGTDEFLKWCDFVGTEPYFDSNFGTGM